MIHTHEERQTESLERIARSLENILVEMRIKQAAPESDARQIDRQAREWRDLHDKF